MRPTFPRLMVFVLLVSVSAAGFAQKKPAGPELKESPVLFHFNRYFGYRSAEHVTDESDYSFTVHEDHSWRFRPMRAGNQCFGKLDMGGISKLSEVLDKVAKIDPVDRTKPRIADSPKISITFTSEKAKAQRELSVQSDLGVELHKWILAVRDVKNPEVISQVKFQGQGRGGRFDAPQVITSSRDLKKTLAGDVLKNISSRVDFDEQQVIVFQWSGSGQDRLDVNLKTNDKSQSLLIKLIRGRTRDLRPHAYAFVLPKDCKWEAK